MRNIKLTIQYDGTEYSGWQSQKNSIAVQDIIEKAIAKVVKENTRIIGAARTDANVHAAGQVANFKTRSRLSTASIKNGLNRNLPEDVAIIEVLDVKEGFHSQFDAKKKLYRYRLYTDKPVPPFFRDFVAPVFYKLDLSLMKREAKVLLGRHDFISFQGAGSPRKSTVRKIYRIDIRKKDKFVEFDIEGDGFLYNMVRTIVGTLIEIGRGYLEKGSMKKILKARNRLRAGATASAKGLFLMKVKY